MPGAATRKPAICYASLRRTSYLAPLTLGFFLSSALMKYLAPLLLGLTSLGGCQSPATTATPVTLLGHWQCDSTSLVRIDQAARPTEAEQITRSSPASPDFTARQVRTEQASLPGLVSKSVYTRRQDTLILRSILVQNMVVTDSAIARWRIVRLTLASLLLENRIDNLLAYPVRLRWYCHR